jgi:hypothetical protein
MLVVALSCLDFGICGQLSDSIAQARALLLFDNFGIHCQPVEYVVNVRKTVVTGFIIHVNTRARGSQPEVILLRGIDI